MSHGPLPRPQLGLDEHAGESRPCSLVHEEPATPRNLSRSTEEKVASLSCHSHRTGCELARNVCVSEERQARGHLTPCLVRDGRRGRVMGTCGARFQEARRKTPWVVGIAGRHRRPNCGYGLGIEGFWPLEL